MKYLDLEMDESWKKVRSELKSRLGLDIYKNWIEVLSLVKVKSNVAHFHVPSSFIANWIDRNYRDQIIESFNKEEIYIENLLFEHETEETLSIQKESSNGQTKDINLSNIKKTKENKDIELPSSPLDKRFTFDRFVVGKPNELAHAAAKRVAESGLVTFNPLFLYGGVGLGKHTLCMLLLGKLKK